MPTTSTFQRFVKSPKIDETPMNRDSASNDYFGWNNDND